MDGLMIPQICWDTLDQTFLPLTMHEEDYSTVIHVAMLITAAQGRYDKGAKVVELGQEQDSR